MRKYTFLLITLLQSIILFSAEPEGNGETTLQRGTANNPQMSLTKISDSELLMVFVGDVPTRSDENSRAVYYSIGDGRTWSNPQIIDDDGTVDDYPNVCDLGDGRLLVTWSSGGQVLPAGATLEDSLKVERKEWLREGQDNIIHMNEYLISQNRYDDLKRATEDEEFREKILSEINAD